MTESPRHRWVRVAASATAGASGAGDPGAAAVPPAGVRTPAARPPAGPPAPAPRRRPRPRLPSPRPMAPVPASRRPPTAAGRRTSRRGAQPLRVAVPAGASGSAAPSVPAQRRPSSGRPDDGARGAGMLSIGRSASPTASACCSDAVPAADVDVWGSATVNRVTHRPG